MGVQLGSQNGQLCYSMNHVDKEKTVVLKQIRLALGLSQDRLSKLIDCSIRKIQRGENGVETSWTLREAQNLHRLLHENFGVGIDALPDTLTYSEPIDFLEEAIAQKSTEV